MLSLFVRHDSIDVDSIHVLCKMCACVHIHVSYSVPLSPVVLSIRLVWVNSERNCAWECDGHSTSSLLCHSTAVITTPQASQGGTNTTCSRVHVEPLSSNSNVECHHSDHADMMFFVCWLCCLDDAKGSVMSLKVGGARMNEGSHSSTLG